MARLTRKQLAAIFAKLRGRGIISYAGAPRGAEGVSGARLPKINILSGGDTPYYSSERLNKLFSRLPQEHLKISNARSVTIGNVPEMQKWLLKRGAPAPKFLLEHVGGLYHKLTHEIFLPNSVRNIAGKERMGYGKIPSWKPGGKRRFQFRVGKGFILEPNPAFDAYNRRNTSTVSATALYHEFGHSIDKGHYSKSLEWFKAAKAWGPRQRYPKTFLPWPSKVMVGESWAEAYALYARSKVSRQRLKREAPEAYAYMKRFFENPEAVKKSFYGEHQLEVRTGIAAAAIGTYAASKGGKSGDKKS